MKSVFACTRVLKLWKEENIGVSSGHYRFMVYTQKKTYISVNNVGFLLCLWWEDGTHLKNLHSNAGQSIGSLRFEFGTTQIWDYWIRIIEYCLGGTNTYLIPIMIKTKNKLYTYFSISYVWERKLTTPNKICSCSKRQAGSSMILISMHLFYQQSFFII